MDRLLGQLVLYRMPEESILGQIAEIIGDIADGNVKNAQGRLHQQIARLLQLSTEYGFDDNLWQNYLAYSLAMHENPFSMLTEKAGAKTGSVNQFAKADFQIFLKLFHYDFAWLEKELGICCFSIITDYQTVERSSRRHPAAVGQKVRALCAKLAEAEDAESVFWIMADFYERYGVGDIGLNKAFRIESCPQGQEIVPITNMEEVFFSTIIGYEQQKEKLIENTESFVEGRTANNVLLYGDSGTGKSTLVKAVLHAYYDRGLRMIELYKHQFQELSSVIARIKNRNYKFIIFMDDLSFEEFEIEYKYLKAVIEGGLEIKPDNVLIYATSNRRHLIRETWSDRSDMSKDELHRSDTMQEKLSLAARFGITIHFSSPDKKGYLEIVKALAARDAQIDMPEEVLLSKALAWEMSHGGMTGRTASQFAAYLSGLSGRRTDSA